MSGIAEKKLTLGETEYFVLGDNSAGSDDSRLADIGNVKREDIGGKVWFVTNIGKNFWICKNRGGRYAFSVVSRSYDKGKKNDAGEH